MDWNTGTTYALAGVMLGGLAIGATAYIFDDDTPPPPPPQRPPQRKKKKKPSRSLLA
jgi:hypothetical protein